MCEGVFSLQGETYGAKKLLTRAVDQKVVLLYDRSRLTQSVLETNLSLPTLVYGGSVGFDKKRKIGIESLAFSWHAPSSN